MSRRATGKTEVTVSLFPFLAVLICTMGSLIVLLVVVVQQAKSQGSNTVEVASVEPPDVAEEPILLPAPVELPEPVEIALQSPVPPYAAPPIEADPSFVLEDQVADVQWANEQLAASRERTRQELAESRMELSRREDQTRRLSEQLDLMEKQAADLLAAEEGRERPNQIAQSEIADLKRKIELAKSDLASKQAAARKVKNQQFSVVAYDGRNGTRRRPVYIECTSRGVTLQPEGIQLSVDDLLVTGPTNALSASLRITREYLSDAGVTEISGEPYPLIIVRPGGETAFVASRRSLKGWDEDWGYELIPKELELAFPERDDSLADILNNTIAQIRNATAPQIAAIKRARAMAQQGHGNASQGYSVGQAAGSGLIPRGGGGRDGRLRQGQGPRGSGIGSGSLSAPQSGLSLAGASSARPTGGVGGSGTGFGQSATGASNIPGSLPNAPNGITAQSGIPGQTGIAQVAGQAGGSSAGQFGSQGPGANSSTGTSYGQPGQDGTPGSSGDSSAAGSAASSVYGSSPGSTGSGQQGSHNQAGSNSRASSFQTGGSSGGSGGPGGSAGSQTGGGGSGQQSQASSGSPGSLTLTPAQGTDSAAPHANSIAASQGSNWALPNANGGGIGITRPLQLYCGAQSIAILPESGTSHNQPENIAINGNLQATMKPLAEAIWNRIENWGIAGPNVYWKPILNFRVEPGTEQQFEQIRVLLDGSGLEVRRTQ